MGDKTRKASLVKLNPQYELSFNMTESGTPISSQMKLNNPTSQVILFKVKTTAPKDYCVRPNSGTLASGQSIDINVMLQNSVSKKGKSKDKFLVQTVCESDVPEGVDDAFKSVSKTLIMEDKLKCNWIFDEEDDDSPVTVRPSTAAQNDPVPPTVPDATSEAPTAAAPRNSSQNAERTVAPPTPAATASAIPPKRAPESVARQMRQASNTTAKTPESSVSASSDRTTAVAQKPQEAPSLILLLVVFILGYIFGKYVV
eukprot:m.282467 g.282467  ORF g.282467 m.282467 type:complete len:257 (+) comp19850_c0_seq2:224-994(+)